VQHNIWDLGTTVPFKCHDRGARVPSRSAATTLALDELGYETLGGRKQWPLVKRREAVSVS